MYTLATMLRRIRGDRHLTQEALAELADVSRVMIARYETGRVMPTVEILIRLADALDVSTDYLLGRSDCQEVNRLFSPSQEIDAPRMSGDVIPEDRKKIKAALIDILQDMLNNA